MRAPSQLDEIPAPFVAEKGQRGWLVARRDLLGELLCSGFGPDDEVEPATSDVLGRRPLGELHLGERRALVRTFHHGGLLRWLTGKRFLAPDRPFEELLLSFQLRLLRVPTSEVVAARARRARFWGWHLDLVSLRLEGTCELGHFLEEVRDGKVCEALRARVLRETGRCLGHMHRAGLQHGDLTPRNLLVERELPAVRTPKVWVLDLDRCRLGEPLGEGERQADLARLLRSVLRIESWGRPFLRRSDHARFLAGYGEGLGRSDPGGWKRTWRGVSRVLRRARPWHRLAGRAEALFGGGPRQRDRVAEPSGGS